MDFDTAFDRLIGHEGGYANHPSDPGGETMWGVTAKVARADGYTGAMRDLPRDRAKSIYRRLYWAPVQADQLPACLRFDVFDAAVNSGPGQAAKWLQQAVGATADGVIGAKTIAAARGADAGAVARFNGIRLRFMTDLPTWPAFGRGWARRIASNLLGA
ncbi:MAG TPA: glycosyl hydrolase 108 family protein [Pseudorhodoferax sp.]|nr:glycosyl hydrolase 108 family protein [Pseudorhodoferax sp.]